MACGMIESNAAAQEGRADGRADTDLDAEDERFGRPVDHRPDDDAHRFPGALTGKALVDHVVAEQEDTHADQHPEHRLPEGDVHFRHGEETQRDGRNHRSGAEPGEDARDPRGDLRPAESAGPKMGTTSAGPAQTPCRT